MESKDIRSLLKVRAGEIVKLSTINAGRSLNSRLASMGLVPNVEIKVISNGHPGPFVISVKGSKMMLGRGIANKIFVSSYDYEKNHCSSGGQSK